MDEWAEDKEGAASRPSVPYMTDEYEPTNPSLWEKVLQVARGELRELTMGTRTIHAPNGGQGFHPWPNPNGSAWAVKQFNGFGGNWKLRKKKAAGWTFTPLQERALQVLAAGGVFLTPNRGDSFNELFDLERACLVRVAGSLRDERGWEITPEGSKVVASRLPEEFDRRMTSLLHSTEFPVEGRKLASWVKSNFRFGSGEGLVHRRKTLREATIALCEGLERGNVSHKDVTAAWAKIQPQLRFLVRYFVEEQASIGVP